MAHEFETGFFVKNEAWHKLGTVLQDYPNTDDAFRESGLNWIVDKRRLMLPHDENIAESGESRYTDAFAIVRRSDDSILGYCKKDYTPWQNQSAFEWMKPLIDTGLWNIETAGSLRKGAVCWALLRQGQAEIVQNDILKEYLLVTWSHDCSSPCIIQPTMIRVVCNNTLLSSLTSGAKYVKVMHTASIDTKMTFIQQLFTQSEDAFKTELEVFSRMLDKKLTVDLMERLIEEFYGNPEPQSNGAISRNENKLKNLKAFVFDGMYSGAGKFGIDNTAYGFFNALSEYNEHYAPMRTQDRGSNILFGRGNEKNKQIITRLVDCCCDID